MSYFVGNDFDMNILRRTDNVYGIALYNHVI